MRSERPARPTLPATLRRPQANDAPVADREAVTLLVGVGAQKAGTSWIAAYLREHPECHVPFVKELHYFDVLHGHQTGFRDIRAAALAEREQGGLGSGVRALWAWASDGVTTDRLRALVELHDRPDPGHGRYWSVLTDGWSGERCVADITPDYSTLDAAGYADILRAFPTARFLLVLRDPVDRTWSNLKAYAEHLRREGRDDLTLDDLVENFLSGGVEHVRHRSDYGAMLEALDAAVPPERLLVLFFEDLFTDASIRRLTRFAGLSHRPARFDKVVLPGRPVALSDSLGRRLRDMLEPVYAAVRARFGDAVPAAWSATGVPVPDVQARQA